MRRTLAPLMCSMLLAATALVQAQSMSQAPSSQVDGATSPAPATPPVSADPPAAKAASVASTSEADALAKQLANPVASLINVPFQFNYDTPVGVDGDRVTLNIQPVIPMKLSERWNLISRTIVPLIDQRDVVPGRHQSGLGDITQTVFFSPAETGPSGVIWGVGPVFVLPTGERGLGAKTWAVGGSVVVLKQADSWTVGMLANHVVDVGGGQDRVDISATFVQPFVTKAFGGGRSLTLNTEATYDWNAKQWVVPVNLVYAKVVKLGKQLYSFNGGVRGYTHTPGRGADWGLRFVVALLYPK